MIAEFVSEAHTVAMNLAAILSLIALTCSGSPPQAPQDRQLSYGSAVTFEDGACWFWTGDAGMTADQFRRELGSHFDRERTLFVAHRANVPARCVDLAKRSAERAGFKKVITEVRADAGPIGPPINGG